MHMHVKYRHMCRQETHTENKMNKFKKKIQLKVLAFQRNRRNLVLKMTQVEGNLVFVFNPGVAEGGNWSW